MTVETMTVPLHKNVDGVIMVNGTRVPLDSIVREFENGVSAEEIALSFTTLRLADIYACISYYLQNQQEVEAYMQERSQRSQTWRDEAEKRCPPQEIRARLLARSAQST